MFSLLFRAFHAINDLATSRFGKKLKECREAKHLSQSEVARLLSTNHSIIGKYERDEVKPTVDVVKKLAEVLETTVGFLMGESQEMDVLKDPGMLKRLNEGVSRKKIKRASCMPWMHCSGMPEPD